MIKLPSPHCYRGMAQSQAAAAIGIDFHLECCTRESPLDTIATSCLSLTLTQTLSLAPSPRPTSGSHVIDDVLVQGEALCSSGLAASDTVKQHASSAEQCSSSSRTGQVHSQSRCGSSVNVSATQQLVPSLLIRYQDPHLYCPTGSWQLCIRSIKRALQQTKHKCSKDEV